MVTIATAHKDDSNSNVLHHDTLPAPLPANPQCLLGIHSPVPVMILIQEPTSPEVQQCSPTATWFSKIHTKRVYFVSSDSDPFYLCCYHNDFTAWALMHLTSLATLSVCHVWYLSKPPVFSWHTFLIAIIKVLSQNKIVRIWSAKDISLIIICPIFSKILQTHFIVHVCGQDTQCQVCK